MLKDTLRIGNSNPKDRTEGLTCWKGNVELKDQILYIKEAFLFKMYKRSPPRQQGKGYKKTTETIQKVRKKTSQINRMVKTSGIAWNRLALLINFCCDTALLIPIHGLCVAGKKTWHLSPLKLFLCLASPSGLKILFLRKLLLWKN